MKKYLSLLMAALVILPAVTFACTEPDKPEEFPDPATAVTAQMVKANNEVKAYVQAMEKYLGCANMSRRDKEAALEGLKDYAESFNVLIREFRARNAS